MKNKNLIRILLFIWIGCCATIATVSAQDLLDTLEKEYPNTPQYELATFKATRISIGHSVENRKKGVLELSVMNRFWNIPDTPNNSFVADKLSARIALEYGITDRLTFGAGGSTLDGLFDGFLKYRFIHQRSDKKGFPLSITLFQNSSYRSKRLAGNINIFDNTLDRLAFTSQLLIARKFTPKFSLQVTPTFIHRGSSALEENPQNQFALGFGGRYKLGGHVSVVSEYYYVANPLESIDTYGAFALGVNWEVSDLLLQFQLTNTRNMVEDAFITQTPRNFNFKDGNFIFGFNAILSLHLSKNKQRKTQ